MKILMIACSLKGYGLANKIKESIQKEEPDGEVTVRVKCSSMQTGAQSREETGDIKQEEILVNESVSQCVSRQFAKTDAIIFVAAAGIAVRSIAPCLTHKSADPAVLAVDETGKFCISLLSGHFGGANELAERIGKMIGAIPVITTATDREKKFSVDLFAKRNGLAIADWEAAKRISAAVLDGKKIGLISHCEVSTCLPDEIVFMDAEQVESMFYEPEGEVIENGILISHKEEKKPFPMTLQLIPQCIVAGIGCRKNILPEKIEEAVMSCLREQNILPGALKSVASIDLKKEEQGILEFCNRHGLPFETYSPQELQKISGTGAHSDFVKEITGVDNVCERSALAPGGRLICPKQVYDGVTVALALQEESVRF